MSLQQTVVRFHRMALALSLTALAACSSSNVIGPENEPEVNNATDNFQWQVSNLDNVSQTLSYTWQNTGTAANVNQSTNPSGGSVRLRIRDADGTEVYSRSLSENGTFLTTGGTTGAWTIDVELSGASGTFNFRVQKP